MSMSFSTGALRMEGEMASLTQTPTRTSGATVLSPLSVPCNQQSPPHKKQLNSRARSTMYVKILWPNMVMGLGIKLVM